MIKKILIVLLLAFIVIQFIRPAKNISTAAEPAAITKVFAVPDSVNKIFEKACYDCHSNNTRYPWYNNIQPVYWWMNDHITKGKQKLNFSDYGSYPLKKQAKRLKDIAKEVEDGGMPLDSYTWIHKDAILTAEEKATLIGWARNTRLKMLSEHVIDTTEKKK
jgi:hypothetical protein